MNKEPLKTFIGSSIAHMPVTNEALDFIAGHFEERDYDKGEFFLKEGRVSGYYYLAAGLMRAFTHDVNGDEVTTYFYPADRVVFDVSSFFHSAAAQESIQAITACSGYVIMYEQLNMLFHAVPEFREFGRLMLIKEFIAYKQRTLAMINQTAEQRYAGLLATHPELLRHAQLRHIASYLGITGSSLSRIRRDFARNGG